MAPFSEITWSVLPKFIFPLVSLLTFDFSWLQLYIFFWSAHFAALLLTTVLLLYHANLGKWGTHFPDVPKQCEGT